MTNVDPVKSGEKVDTRFKPGAEWHGNAAGRPPGTFSIKTKVIKYLQDHPEEFEDLITYYAKDKKMRALLWQMIDGLPRQQVDASVTYPKPIMGGTSAIPSNDSLPEDTTAQAAD